MPKPSNQLIVSAIASVLAMGALALTGGAPGGAVHGGASLVPVQAGIELPGLPEMPTLLPR